MEAKSLILIYRNFSPTIDFSELRQLFAFNLVGEPDHDYDENLDYRTEITEALLHEFSFEDIKMIRELFREELNCERAIGRHDNLYQLSFYLFSLGQLEDTFILYESKYGINHMDSSTMQDQYFITVGHEPDTVIDYVRSRFSEGQGLTDAYPGLISELENIRDEQDHGTVTEYSQFIRGYFFGHDKNEQGVRAEMTNPILKKPWWKFW